MTVHILPSARHQTAEANLAAFIERARSSAALGLVDFDEPVWTVNLVKKKRASSARSGVNRLYFTEAKAGARTELGREPLREPFASFLKAIVRLREDAAPSHLDDHGAMIRAGRYLHAEVEAISYDPTLLLSDHFERAAHSASAVDAPSTAYAVGKKLVEIAGWVNRYNTARVKIDFKNPNQRMDDTNARLGKEAEARRAAKLPSEASLNALALLANKVTEDVDVLRMRTIELLVCGGWRINELLSIPADCEVEEQAYENGEPVLDAQGEPVIRYGIRYWGEKGAPPLPKWIPTPLVDVAKRAINDIRRITQPTRDAVAFMQRHPWGVLATGLADGDPDELITMRELVAILGVFPTGGQQWCRNWQVPLQKMGATLVARRRDIARVIRSDIPELPPDSPLELGEHLFLTPVNFTHPQRAAIPGSVRFLTDGMVAGFITGKEKAPSAFERFGMVEEDGSPIRMNTHQFRHWLNTLAQQGGMSQLEIARWSGRKDVAQNAAYDHVSGAQLASRIRDLVEAGDIRGPIGTVSERLPPLDRDTFLEAEIPTAHVTDIGVCVHDWSLLPCTNHGACAGCEEHLVLKGDEKQRIAAQRLASEMRALVEAAEAEDADGTYGADRWVTAQKRVLSGVESILAVHADVSIPDGTVVQLPSIQASN